MKVNVALQRTYGQSSPCSYRQLFCLWIWPNAFLRREQSRIDPLDQPCSLCMGSAKAVGNEDIFTLSEEFSKSC